MSRLSARRQPPPQSTMKAATLTAPASREAGMLFGVGSTTVPGSGESGFSFGVVDARSDCLELRLEGLCARG